MTRKIALFAALALSACSDSDPELVIPSPVTPNTPQGVAVTADEYEFRDVPPTLKPGKATFVLSNVGKEDHEMSLALIKGDQSLEELLELPENEVSKVTEDAGRAFAEAGLSSGFNTTLKPGRYGYVCFVETKDGTPHAFLGMTGEFTVA